MTEATYADAAKALPVASYPAHPTVPEVSIEDQLDAFLDWKTGEGEVEYWDKYHQAWLPLRRDAESPILAMTLIRRKPEQPKCRPWKHDEVPVGAIVRSKVLPAIRRSIVASSGTWALLGGMVEYDSFTMLLSEWTLEDGSPCGVRET